MRKTLISLLVFFSLSASAQEVLTLEVCKQIALSNNRILRIDSSNLQSAKYSSKSAFANYFPDISFSGIFLRLNKQFQMFKNDLLLPVIPYQAIDAANMQVSMANLNNPQIAPLTFALDPATGMPLIDANGNPVFKNYAWLPANQSKLGEKDNFLFNLSLTQPIFVGGKIYYANKMAQNAVEIARYKTEIDRQSLLYEVEDLYYNVWIIDKKYKLALKHLDLLKEIEKDVENYLKEGLITSNQLLMIRSKINQAQVDIFKAKNGLSVQKQLLNQKIGRDIQQDFTVEDSLKADFEVIQNILNTQLSIDSRPEVKLLEQKVLLNKNLMKVTQADMMPQLGLTANYFFVNPNPYKGLEDEFGDDYALGLSLKIPLFHAFERYNKRQSALLQYKSAQLEMEDNRNLLNIEAIYTSNQLKEQFMQVEAARKNVELARENLRIQTDMFHEGMLKLSDLTEAQTMWLKAETDYYEAYANLLIYHAKLRKSYGILQ